MVKNPVLGLFEGTECGDLKQIVTHGAFKMQKKRPSREAMIFGPFRYGRIVQNSVFLSRKPPLVTLRVSESE